MPTSEVRLTFVSLAFIQFFASINLRFDFGGIPGVCVCVCVCVWCVCVCVFGG